MNKLILMAAALMTVSCAKDDTVLLPDLTPEVRLLQANDKLQDTRLNSLESRVADLEGRMEQAEDDIDNNEEDILELFDIAGDLGEELDELREDLRDEVRRLKRADRRTRRMIRNKVRRLSRQLAREVRSLERADRNLQDQIDDLEEEVEYNTARQMVINRILFRGMMMTNIRINQLQRQINWNLSRINRRLNVVESDIDDITTEIAGLQSQIDGMQAQLDDVESRLVSVVYPCGEGNSEEVLLQTQDGLVAYHQRMRTQRINIRDSITIEAYTIPGHYHRYGYFGSWTTRYAGEHTIPAQTYNIGDTARVQVLDKAFLDVLNDGNYRTTDGHSCNFTIQNGEVLND